MKNVKLVIIVGLLLSYSCKKVEYILSIEGENVSCYSDEFGEVGGKHVAVFSTKEKCKESKEYKDLELSFKERIKKRLLNKPVKLTVDELKEKKELEENQKIVEKNIRESYYYKVNKNTDKLSKVMQSNPGLREWEDLIRKKSINIGMPTEALILSWGEPRRISKDSKYPNKSEYHYLGMIIYIENNVITRYIKY